MLSRRSATKLCKCLEISALFRDGEVQGATRRPCPWPKHSAASRSSKATAPSTRRKGDLRAAAGCDREIGIALAEAGKLEAALDPPRSARARRWQRASARATSRSATTASASCSRASAASTRRCSASKSARGAYAAQHRYLAVADCEEHIGYALLALDRPGAAVSHLSHARELHDEAGRTRSRRRLRGGPRRRLRPAGAPAPRAGSAARRTAAARSPQRLSTPEPAFRPRAPRRARRAGVRSWPGSAPRERRRRHGGRTMPRG